MDISKNSMKIKKKKNNYKTIFKLILGILHF